MVCIAPTGLYHAFTLDGGSKPPPYRFRFATPTIRVVEAPTPTAP